MTAGTRGWLSRFFRFFRLGARIRYVAVLVVSLSNSRVLTHMRIASQIFLRFDFATLFEKL